MIEFQNNGYLQRDLIEKIIRESPETRADAFRCWSFDFIHRNIFHDESTLDILCGKNPLWEHLCKEGYNVRGIDGAVSNFGHAKKDKRENIMYKSFPIRLAEIPPLPCVDKQFDCVTMINVWRWLHPNQQHAGVDFSVYNRDDFFKCQMAYIPMLKEACRVARKRVVIVERVHIHPEGTWNCNFYSTFLEIENHGFFIGGVRNFVFPEPFPEQVGNFSVVDKTKGGKRATYYGIGIVAIREDA